MQFSFKEQLFQESLRWPVWLPVLYGIGVAIYFAFPHEPAIWASIIPCLIGLAVLLNYWKQPNKRWLIALFFCPALGFAIAQSHTLLTNTTMLDKPLSVRPVQGKIERIEWREKNLRLILSDISIPRLAPDRTPGKIRLTLRHPKEEITLLPGSRIKVLARLTPPSGPVAPGSFDFRRRAWFEKIGATGFGMGKVDVLTPAKSARGTYFFENTRQAIVKKIKESLQGDQAAVSIALLTGRRGDISEEIWFNMRESGLSHLLAISGLHIGLIAGFLFFVIRAVLAANMRLALNYPIKKWAALVSLAGTVFYMVLVGAPLPTQRATFMTGLVMMAIIVDRKAISMRLVALAAGLILLISPVSLTTASFQMSFAAVIALVATYEAMKGTWRRWYEKSTWVKRATLYVIGVILTSVVAGLATSPYSLYHFQQMANYGLLANIVAVPLTGFWIMPWGIISIFAMFFGLAEIPLKLMGLGIAWMLGTAEGVAQIPGASIHIPAPPLIWLITISLGGLWLCLWRQKWRLFGLGVMTICIAWLPFVKAPDILLLDNGKLSAVQTDGTVSFSTLRRESFARKLWLQRFGAPTLRPSSFDKSLSCDSLGCISQIGMYKIAIVKKRMALQDDCELVDILIAPSFPVYGCKSPIVIDFFDLWAKGSHALFLTTASPFIQTARADRGARPWHPQRSNKESK